MQHTTGQLLPVTYRGFMYPWQLDQRGRMNAHFYAARCDEASWQLLALLGIGPRWLRAERRGFVALERKVSHEQEVRAATVLQIDSALLEVGH